MVAELDVDEANRSRESLRLMLPAAGLGIVFLSALLGWFAAARNGPETPGSKET